MLLQDAIDRTGSIPAYRTGLRRKGAHPSWAGLFSVFALTLRINFPFIRADDYHAEGMSGGMFIAEGHLVYGLLARGFGFVPSPPLPPLP